MKNEIKTRKLHHNFENLDVFLKIKMKNRKSASRLQSSLHDFKNRVWFFSKWYHNLKNWYGFLKIGIGFAKSRSKFQKSAHNFLNRRLKIWKSRSKLENGSTILKIRINFWKSRWKIENWHRNYKLCAFFNRVWFFSQNDTTIFKIDMDFENRNQFFQNREHKCRHTSL